MSRALPWMPGGTGVFSYAYETEISPTPASVRPVVAVEAGRLRRAIGSVM
ncbi:hypothetical protein [Streptomyces microflavus]